MKVKILHCVETIGPGGVEQRRLSISRYLDHGCYELALTCSQAVGEFDKRLIEAGMSVEQLGIMGSPFNVRYYRNLFRVIRRFRPHIIHGAVFEGVISAVIGGFFFRVPVVVIEETSDPTNRSWRGHLLLYFMSKFADAIVAISPAVYDYLTLTLRLPASKTHLILNGVDPPSPLKQDEVDQCRSFFNINQKDFVVGSVGRLLDDHKLVSILIRAFKKFADKHDDAKLLVIGDGVDRPKLEQLATTLGLTNRVIFAGHQTNVNVFYGVMNAFALVPDREGFGMAAAEAMFFGLPVIATKVGGLKQIVVHNETGLLIEPHSVDQLLGAIEHLYSHPEELDSMGKAGYKRAIERYTAKRYVNDLENLYQQLIKKKL